MKLISFSQEYVPSKAYPTDTGLDLKLKAAKEIDLSALREAGKYLGFYYNCPILIDGKSAGTLLSYLDNPKELEDKLDKKKGVILYPPFVLQAQALYSLLSALAIQASDMENPEEDLPLLEKEIYISEDTKDCFVKFPNRLKLESGTHISWDESNDEELNGLYFVASRSGLAKHSISVVNAPGIIDFGYGGDVSVILQNQGDSICVFTDQARIAQLVLPKNIEVVQLTEKEEKSLVTSSHARGNNGFGSSGVL